MEKFIGTKIVQAEPAYRLKGTLESGEEVYEIIPVADCLDPETIDPGETETVEGVTGEEGYKIRYADGYESWSPREVFEQAYRQVDGMNFGLALEAAKKGEKIARKGWNGKGQYVELGRSFAYFTDGKEIHDTHHEDIGSKALVFVGTRGRQVGWLASQADMLADDWMIVPEVAG